MGRLGLLGNCFQENNSRRALPPPYEGENEAFRRAIPGGSNVDVAVGGMLREIVGAFAVMSLYYGHD